ncbi:MAG: hypothetical protein KJ985_10415 [Proteobacteria bacterium]|nr:hypothetical protein [Pseudomonadota bacterium]
MQIKIVALNARFTHSCLALFHVRNELEKKCPGMEIELCQLTINDSYYETLDIFSPIHYEHGTRQDRNG